MGNQGSILKGHNKLNPVWISSQDLLHYQLTMQPQGAQVWVSLRGKQHSNIYGHSFLPQQRGVHQRTS